MLFKKFFVTSGVGLSRTSKLNAFDKALMEAGICQCNLVPVSSILAKGAKQINPVNIEPSSITFTVLARMDGSKGECISAGLGWTLCKNSKGEDSYGIVVEDRGKESECNTKENIELKMGEMLESRRMIAIKKNVKIAHIDEIPKDNFGSVIVALIYLD